MYEMKVGDTLMFEVRRNAVDEKGERLEAEVDRVYCKTRDGSAERIDCTYAGNIVKVVAKQPGRARIEVISKHTDPEADIFDFSITTADDEAAVDRTSHVTVVAGDKE